MRCILFSVAFLLFTPLVAFGQITIPDEIEPCQFTPVSVNVGIPDGAKVEGGLSLTGSGLYGETRAMVSDNKWDVWMVVSPGTWELSFVGFWVHTEVVKFTDGNGKEITITSYLGHGVVNEKVTFTVGPVPEPDPDPDPDPPPPPDPTGDKQIMMMYDGEQFDRLPLRQRQLLTSLTDRKALVSDGHIVLEILERAALSSGVSADLKPFIDAILRDDTPLPAVAFAPRSGGKVATKPLPNSLEELRDMLK